jgi:hypothetical protein
MVVVVMYGAKLESKLAAVDKVCLSLEARCDSVEQAFHALAAVGIATPNGWCFAGDDDACGSSDFNVEAGGDFVKGGHNLM